MTIAIPATNTNNNHEGQASALEQLRARIQEMKEAAYTFGDYSQEAVTIALDGVVDVIDELMNGLTASQPGETEVPAPSTNGRVAVDLSAVRTLVDYCDNECRDVPQELIDNARASLPDFSTHTGPTLWALVPMTPTDDMIVAFAETWYSKLRCIDDCQMEDAYAAMIAAAPFYGAGLHSETSAIDDGLLNEIELYFDANANVSEACADFLERLGQQRTIAVSRATVTAAQQ